MIDCVSEHDEAFASCLTRNVGYVARVYPLVEIISEIVQTTEPLARAKFAKGLDVEEYLSRDRKRGRKPKTAREKNLERFATELATKLASKGGTPPAPEDYDVDLPASVWEAVKESGRLSTAGQQGTSAIADITIKSLRNKIKALEDELQNRETTSIVSVKKPQTKLFKKFN
jgi:hypothetical protein